MGEELGEAHGRHAVRLACVDLELLDERARRRAASRGFRSAPGVGMGGARRGLLRRDDRTSRSALRERLTGEVPFSSLAAVREALARDGTEKALFETADGRPMEAVLMRYRDGRRSLCVSSQSGCPLTCTFCATGQMSFGRNLTRVGDPRPGAPLPAQGGGRPRGVHGHGRAADEPRQRAGRMRAAARHRDRATRTPAISTVGWIPGIERMAEEGPPVRLALSLHAPEDALRSRADAGERALPAARRARRLPALARAPPRARCSSST